MNMFFWIGVLWALLVAAVLWFFTRAEEVSYWDEDE